jgi:hypothetical protein
MNVDFSALDAELADPFMPAPLFPLDDLSDHMLREEFARTTSHWDELYDPCILSPDADFTLQMMMSSTAERPTEGDPWRDHDPRLSTILSMGLGGYVWRSAELAAGRTVGTEIVAGVREAIGSVTVDSQVGMLGASREQGVLYQASARAIAALVPLWYTSPGYIAWGGILYRAGRRMATERLANTEHVIHPADIDYAFSFGVALRDVEEQLRNVDAPRPGEYAGPEWETCEIDLRTADRIFVAVADDRGRRYAVAQSKRLPVNRLPLPLSIDRRPTQIMNRHEELVAELTGQGWIPIAGNGTDWWSHRFRRRTS